MWHNPYYLGQMALSVVFGTYNTASPERSLRLWTVEASEQVILLDCPESRMAFRRCNIISSNYQQYFGNIIWAMNRYQWCSAILSQVGILTSPNKWNFLLEWPRRPARGAVWHVLKSKKNLRSSAWSQKSSHNCFILLSKSFLKLFSIFIVLTQKS